MTLENYKIDRFRLSLELSRKAETSPSTSSHNVAKALRGVHLSSVTRFGDFLDFGQLFKAFGNN